MTAHFTVHDAKMIYLLSRQQHFDESKDSKCECTFIDFLECLFRVADMLSFPTAGDVKALGFKCFSDYDEGCARGFRV